MATHQGRKRKKTKAQKQPVAAPKLSAFLLGVASVLDVGGTLYRGRTSPPMDDASARRADARALAGDWAMVGNDLWAAIGTYQTPNGQTDRA